MAKYKVKIQNTFTEKDQKLLFRLGYRWAANGQTVQPDYANTKHIYLDSDMDMTRDIFHTDEIFEEKSSIEIDYFLLFTVGQIVPISDLPKVTTHTVDQRNLCAKIALSEGTTMSYGRQKMHYSVFNKDKNIDYKGLIYQEYKVLDYGGEIDQRPLVREAIQKELNRVSVRIMTGIFEVNAGCNIQLAAVQNNLNKAKDDIQAGKEIKLINVIAYYEWEKITSKPIPTHDWIKQYLTEANFNSKKRVLLFTSNNREIAINNGKIYLYENARRNISYTCDIKYDDFAKEFYF